MAAPGSPAGQPRRTHAHPAAEADPPFLQARLGLRSHCVWLSVSWKRECWMPKRPGSRRHWTDRNAGRRGLGVGVWLSHVGVGFRQQAGATREQRAGASCAGLGGGVVSQEGESGCGVPIKKVVLVSCLQDDRSVLRSSPLWAGRKSLGEIKEDSLVHVNVISCLRRLGIGTFCFQCCMSCVISMRVVKGPLLLPLREPHLAQLIAALCNLCLSRLSHFRRAALLPCFGQSRSCSLQPLQCRPGSQEDVPEPVLSPEPPSDLWPLFVC